MKTVTINGKRMEVTHARIYRGSDFTNFDFHLYTKDGHTMTGIQVDENSCAKHQCRHTGIKTGERVEVGQDFVAFADLCDRQDKAVSALIRSQGRRIRLEGGDAALVAASEAEREAA